VRLIEDPELEPPVITVPVELVVRESSGGARAEEAEEGTPEGRRPSRGTG
jgi:hypothetical protein